MARRILLADDSVTAQNMGRRILTDAGYEVVTVNNGSAALKKIAENKPDLIVLDVYMPGYGGLEVCQRVKENPETKQIPVLLTVGKLEPFKADEARRVGADSFIIKPFEATELLTVLTKLEDKIVAQPQPQKSGRFAKALAAVEQSDKGDRFGDKETGWKNRLTIPVPHAKPADQAPEIPAASVGPEIGATASRDSEPAETVKPVEARGFERPMPAGLPADITPEEIAAITAAAAAFGGKTEQASAVEPSLPDAVASQEISIPEVASGQPIEAVRSAEVQAAAPEAIQPEVAHADVAQPEASQELQASAPVEAVPEAVASVEAAKAEPHVQEIQAPATQIEPQPASAELPTVAASAENNSEAQISQPTPPVAGDADVMAALASLVPSNGYSDSVYSGSNGSHAIAIAADTASGPRWIAHRVEVGLDESKLALDQEMDQVLAARASAEAASLSAAAESASSELANSELAKSGAVAIADTEQPVVTEAVATEAIAAESVIASESIQPTVAAQASVSEFGINESSAGESAAIEASAVEVSAISDQPPAVAEASAYAAAAAAGAGLSGSESSGAGLSGAGLSGSELSGSELSGFGSSGFGLPDISSEQVAAVEAVSATAAVPENSAVAQVETAPPREAELAAAWQNWKQIRESFGGSPSAPKAEVPAEPSSELTSRQEQAAPAPSASAEAVEAPVEVEEADTDAPEESSTIASIVDNMLAELRPKLVAEIAKKMNSDKKEKEKKKKK